MIQSSSSVDKLKDWNEVEERIKNQMPLRLLSCVQLASKLSSHCKVMVKWVIYSVCVCGDGDSIFFERGGGYFLPITLYPKWRFTVAKVKLKFDFW